MAQQEQQESPQPQWLLWLLPHWFPLPQQQKISSRMMMSQMQEELLLSKHIVVTSLVLHYLSICTGGVRGILSRPARGK